MACRTKPAASSIGNSSIDVLANYEPNSATGPDHVECSGTVCSIVNNAAAAKKSSPGKDGKTAQATARILSRRERRVIHRSVSCWIFDNRSVARFIEFILTEGSTEAQVRSILGNSSNSMWFDENHRKIIRFLQAGLSFQFVDDRVSAIAEVPFTEKDRLEMLEILDSLTTPKGELSHDPELRELMEEQKRELIDSDRDLKHTY